MHAYMLNCFSCVQFVATLWTIARQAPLSWDSPGKNTGVDCNALLQGIFPTQGSNPSLLHGRQILYQLSHQGSPNNGMPHFILYYFKSVPPFPTRKIKFQ